MSLLLYFIYIIYMHIHLCLCMYVCIRSWVGVTKTPFINFSISKNFDPPKVPARFFESQTESQAELRRHLSNINMIFNSSLQSCHNERVSNHRRLECLLNHLFRRRSENHQSSASLAFVWGIHRSPVNSPRKEPVMRKMFPFDDVIM